MRRVASLDHEEVPDDAPEGCDRCAHAPLLYFRREYIEHSRSVSALPEQSDSHTAHAPMARPAPRLAAAGDFHRALSLMIYSDSLLSPGMNSYINIET